ncbi:hypothetical protein [Lysinibacillus sphaericus]|uniref:Tn554-related, transposase B n=1 Tax=Lysinibacillus sphaericus OT4b.31 TaxID=1285586 RepID=R7Z9R5_LYSSH|nr:hypothetical protein [Lysinibacillus sphaericus]EON70691.1 Tn554-related, transposase B [Lysinibacillus sphaericus OT4b.31]
MYSVMPQEDIPTDILDALWQDHKLNAMDNPYGTSHAHLKGNCAHMEAPPCLTCHDGSPCKDLAIDFSELDVQKYERIETLRQQQAQTPTPKQRKREMSDSNKDVIIESLKRRIMKKEEENKQLRNQLKMAYTDGYNQIYKLKDAILSQTLKLSGSFVASCYM